MSATAGRHHSHAARRHDDRPLRRQHQATTFPAICLPPSDCHTPSALAAREAIFVSAVPQRAGRTPRGGMSAPGLPRTAATRPGPLAPSALGVTHG